MTPEQTKQAAAVMLAAADGKRIQIRRRREGCQWLDCCTPVWNLENYDYRVKPEPREWWECVRTCSDVVCARFKSKFEADEWINRSKEHACNFQIVHVREVIE